MTDAPHTQDWVGLYLPEDDGVPVALFREGAHVTALLHQQLGRTDGVTAATRSLDVHEGVREQFRSRAADDAAGEPAGVAKLRGEIRTQLTQETLRAAIEAEERDAMGLPARPGAPKVSDQAAADLGLERASARRGRAAE